MSLEYVLMDVEEAYNKGLIAYRKPYSCGQAFFRVENGIYTFLGTDDGEPEDKNFFRDFSWVGKELYYARDHMSKGTLPPTDAEESTAKRNKVTEAQVRRDCATTPEDRAYYTAMISQIRENCNHTKTLNTGSSIECLECGLCQ